eukprot:7272900-Prymnesium_polylepis.1
MRLTSSFAFFLRSTSCSSSRACCARAHTATRARCHADYRPSHTAPHAPPHAPPHARARLRLPNHTRAAAQACTRKATACCTTVACKRPGRHISARQRGSSCACARVRHRRQGAREGTGGDGGRRFALRDREGRARRAARDDGG